MCQFSNCQYSQHVFIERVRIILAGANITKKAMAAALKELMETKCFAHITVEDICKKCQINRKSFYYHFKDKYHLLNWIYFTEFLEPAHKREHPDNWDLLEEMCNYFYANQTFYRKAFKIDGQNSFFDYFREVITVILSKSMEDIFGKDASLDFYTNFYVDAFVYAIRRWLLQKDCMPSQEFAEKLKQCVVKTSKKIIQDYPNEGSHPQKGIRNTDAIG